ncbi:VWA domain-containing protein [Luteimonas sp. MJ250]|uniref:vWA domain-containing protein n=1 Tax=Luteimonas sp. MJ250 TaxID=3129236 RepID=UPI0031BA8D60
MLRHLTLALIVGLAAPLASAQARQTAASDTILVFDASGSMWGQIDGVPKITIARDVVQSLLNDLPPERRLGLVVYGHNRKGDCGDIQTLVPVGTDRAAIGKAIASVNPVGMTPMTAAVEHAAEVLKSTENQATVILVSDGQETCHKDPCQAAANLEKMGIGLTVHTVGFGLGAEEAGAKGELSCIAEATGGRFFLADDADELRAALDQISAAQVAPAAKPAPAAEPAPVATVEISLSATDQEKGPTIRQGLTWTVRHGATGEILHEQAEAGAIKVKLPRGVHDVTVQRASDGASAEGQITGSSLTLPIIVALDASIDAPATGAAGATVRVAWTGPDQPGDYISVARPDAAGGAYENYAYTRKGNPLQLLLPKDPGTYEVRYVLDSGRKVLVRETIAVTDITASVEVPATAEAGSTLTMAWTGPDYSADFISVAKPEARGGSYENYTYTRDGNPLRLLMPADAGAYEVRYIQAQGHKVLAREAITITAVAASLQEIPSTATAGSRITVAWTGPDYSGDFITVAKPAAAGGSYESYTYTREGSPLQLRMPATAGTYEVRYVQKQKATVLARETIKVTPGENP